eukprot:scaffold60102_cov53-Attheya_sp.AAC.5
MIAPKSVSFTTAFIMMMQITQAFIVVPPNAAGVSPLVEQVRVVPSVVDLSSAPVASSSNVLISQIMLAAADANNKAPAAKSTNVASGSGVSITDIHYDGIVPKTEADEYVIISNNGSNNNVPVDVSGYYIYVATTGTQGPTFYFPKGSSIKPSSSVRLYTNEIHKETGGYSYGSGKALWNNNGGLAVLKDSNGKKLGEYKYKPAQ